MNQIKNFIVALTLCLTGPLAFSQGEDIFVYGQIKDSESLKKLEGVTVEILKDGSIFDTYDAGTSGKYEFYVPLGSNYDIRFYKDGYINKMVRIDTRNIPEEDRKGGFKLNMDMTLFVYVEGFNTDILKEPIGKAGFDPVKNSIEFDFDYTEKIQAKIDAEYKRLEDLAGEMERLKKEFDDLMLKGDQKMLEKKYQEAMGKFEAAKNIFPDNKDAQSKYLAAKEKYEAEQANKDREARYIKFMADGDKNIKSKSWEEAKNNFTEASKLKPEEKLPKDKLAEIEKALAAMANKEQYDLLIKDADAKFANKDYAVCIEKYTEASEIMPDEIYPKTQITKAKELLDDLLSDEQARLELERKYKDLCTLGERNMKSKDYETSKQNFEEASLLKPEEQYPIDKIAELDKLIAELAEKSDKNASDKLADEEKARIEKEYQDHVDLANTLFEEGKLPESRSEYEAALGVKPSEKYPKTRISRIDELLAQASKENKDDKADKALADEERLKAEALAKKEMEDKIKKAEEDRLARIEAEKLERDRLAEERSKKEEEDRKRSSAFMSNVDKAHEDEVEAYMREAREGEDQAKYNKIRQDKEDFDSFLTSKQEESTGKTSENMEEVKNHHDQLERIQRNGQLANTTNVTTSANEKEKVAKTQQEYEQKSGRMREDAVEKIEKTKDIQDDMLLLDQKRQANVTNTEQKKEKVMEQQQSMEKRGDAFRKDGEYDVKKSMEEQVNQANKGEDVRQENIAEINSKVKETIHQAEDASAAANERLFVAHQKTEQKKEQVKELDDSKKDATQENISKVNELHQKEQMFNIEKESRAAADRYEKRNDLFDKNAGDPKSADDYEARPGTEDLPEGVTENSYQLGNNKIVIERTVKLGNKVDFYRKVISKSGTYYFKNGQSITELMWDQETLKNHE